MFEFNENTKIVFGDDELGMNYIQDKLCSKCGNSLNDFLETGKLGCANCYKVFESEIRTNLLQIQGAISHAGKVSLKHTSKIKTKEMIAMLEKEKEKAAEEENYILAEDLKNKIEKLKGELWYERL